MIETLTVEADHTTLDLLLWRRYRREAKGLVEDTLARNPGLAALGAILPIGTVVQVEAPAPATDSAATTVRSLYD
jgi:phage tail protein X